MTATYPSQSTANTQTEPVQNGVKPRYAVTGDKDTYAVRVELPGVKKDGVEIRLEKDLLTILAKRSDSPLAGWRPLHRELSQENYSLRLRLNVPVDENRLEAKLEDGVLQLSLPIKEAAKPKRIQVM
jgi:HSP20 family protein